MKSFGFRRTSVAFALVIAGALLDVSSAWAIKGCQGPPRPTNPDDAGYANCLAAANAGCRSQCRALNRCYNANNPASTVGCEALLREFNECRNPTGSAIGSGFQVTWDGAGCAYAPPTNTGSGSSGGALINGMAAQGSAGVAGSGGQSALSSIRIGDCPYVVVGVVANYMGVPGGALTMSTDLRSDLGASEGEIEDMTTLMGDQFGVTIDPEVAANVKTLGDIVSCIETAVN